MTSIPQLVTTVGFVTLLVTSCLGDSTWTKDIKVKYYGQTVLNCSQNYTVIPDTSQVFWITPDASIIKENTPTSDMPDNVQLVNGSVVSMLNVTQISDPQFGHYTCVMIKTNGDVDVVRWGLNVNGADFSELERQYRKNAVVGAIAAAVMVVLLGGACLIWHFRYSRRNRADHTGSPGIDEKDLKKPTSHQYKNNSFDVSEELDSVEIREQNTMQQSAAAAGTDNSDDPHERNGKMEAVKM